MMLQRMPSEEFDPSAPPEGRSQRKQALQRAYKAFGIANPNEAPEGSQDLAANQGAPANEASSTDQNSPQNSPPQADAPQANAAQADAPQDQQQQEQKRRGDSCKDFLRCVFCWCGRDQQEDGGEPPNRAGSQASRQSRFREQMDVSLPANDPRHEERARPPPNVQPPSEAVSTPKGKGRAGKQPDAAAAGPSKKVAYTSVTPVSPPERTFGLRGPRGKRVPGEEAEEEYPREEGVFPIEDVHGPPPNRGPAANAPAKVAGSAAGDAAENQQASQVTNQHANRPRLRRVARLPPWVVQRQRSGRGRGRGRGAP